MKKTLAVLALSGLSSLCFATQHAFLVQNSGWMEPFYQDSSSQFKPLINGVIQTITTTNDQIVVSTFNQTNSLAPSPQMLYQGEGAKDLSSLLQKQGLAYKHEKAYADTDFTEAVVSTIQKPFAGKSGIIWIFTNNKNSPNNDAETTARNKEFYSLIHDNPAINKVLAFPLKMPVQGKHFQASGLMVYALAYGESAEKDLNKLVETGKIAKIFTQQPALLKPLNKEPIRLIPVGVENSSDIQTSLSDDRKALFFDMQAKNIIPEIKLKADLKNNFYPYNIAATKVDAQLILATGQTAPIAVQYKDIQLLTAENTRLEFKLPIPSDVVVSAFSWPVIKAMGKQVIIPAQIQVNLYEQQLTLSEQFQENLQQLFPNDPLSDVFVPPANIESSTAVIPVYFRLQYPLWPVVLVIGSIIFLLLGLLLALALLSRTQKYDVLVNGIKKQTIQLKPFSQHNVYGENAQVIAIVKRGFSKPNVELLDNNILVTIR